MNKKKWLTLGGAIGISGVVMVTTGLSAMASTSGYDTYKSALKNTKTVKSVSVQAEASLQDNGSVLTNAKGSFKANLENRTGSGNVSISGSGADQTVDFFKQDNSTVMKSGASDVYYVKQEGSKDRKRSKEQDNPQMTQQVETVVDALVGNLKDYVTVDTKSDGSKQVSVQMENAQIPAVVNAIVPIAIKNALNEHENHQKDLTKEQNDPEELLFNKDQFSAKVPQLTTDIKIVKVAVKADINADNYIESQQADITVSGKDANGTAHEVTLHVNADLSGYNSTSPDKVDLAGKNVQQVKREFKDNR